MNRRTIKALKTCQFLPAAEREILDSLPEELTEQLTSKQLALVMQALDKHWHKACAWKEKQIVADAISGMESNCAILSLQRNRSMENQSAT